MLRVLGGKATIRTTEAGLLFLSDLGEACCPRTPKGRLTAQKLLRDAACQREGRVRVVSVEDGARLARELPWPHGVAVADELDATVQQRPSPLQAKCAAVYEEVGLERARLSMLLQLQREFVHEQEVLAARVVSAWNSANAVRYASHDSVSVPTRPAADGMCPSMPTPSMRPTYAPAPRRT